MNLEGWKIRPSKHFILGWMRKWNWDVHELRKALEGARKVDKVGKNKYEVYIHTKGKGRKIIFVKDEEMKELFVITGAEGT
ncbi:MAG: hypothetical protein V1743_02470 [Nanoarchaeota archaeon]